MSVIQGAMADLREHQQQLDMDGIVVGVSRQALEMTLDYADKVEAAQTAYRTQLSILLDALDHHPVEAEVKELMDDAHRVMDQYSDGGDG